MTVQCVLDAGGFQVAFAFDNGDSSRDYLDTTVELALAPALGAVTVKSLPTFLAVNELQRLAVYLEDHIAALQTDPNREAPPFVPLELGFQMQALSGDVFAEMTVSSHSAAWSMSVRGQMTAPEFTSVRNPRLRSRG